MADQPKPENTTAQRSNLKKPPPRKSKKAGARPDFATVGGILLAFGGIVGGLLMEGGKISDVSQITAALIVLGGTFGAVMVSTPIRVLNGAAMRLIHVLMDKTAISRRRHRRTDRLCHQGTQKWTRLARKRSPRD